MRQLQFLTIQIHYSAWRDAHQKTDSLNRQFASDSPYQQQKWLLGNTLPTSTRKQLKLIPSFPFLSSMSFIKHSASSFPLFAASEISDSARSAFCSIPRPNAQHLASMSMESVSPRATQSSRSVTAFGWFCGTPFPSISFLACSLFSSTCFCAAETSSCALSCSWAVCLSVILFAVLFLHFFFREKVNQSPLFLRIELFHTFFSQLWIAQSSLLFFTIIFVCFCQWTSGKRAIHTVSKERGGDYRTMTSCQGVLRERGWKRVKEGGFDWWMVWKWVSWGGHQQLSMSAHVPIPCEWGTVSCVSKPMCSCQLDQFHGVDVCQVWTLCKAFRKWNGFGDDVIAEQPSHPHLVIHNIVCHVTPRIFFLVNFWLEQCSIIVGINQAVDQHNVCSWCVCLQWKHSVKPNTMWSLSLSTTMKPCGSACCGVHWGVWCVVHHQWFVVCRCWGWATLVLVSMIVASTYVPLSKSSQIHSPTSGHTLFLKSILRSLVAGDFQTQCHLWWLMKRVFNSLMSWCIPSFPFLLWMLIRFNSKPCVMMSCIIIMLNVCYLIVW